MGGGITAAFGSFGRFLGSGAFNTLATYLLYLGLLTWLPYRISYTVAYACGIGLAYVMNRYLVFRRSGGQAGPFLVALIYAGQYLLNLAIVTAAVRWLSVPPAWAPLIAIALTLPLTYFLNRRVFSAQPRRVELAPALDRVRHGWSRAGVVVLVGLPILSLALNAIAWVRFGYDLPFFDDWRGYDTREIDSFQLSYLFRPMNDTLTPIGLALDAIAQRLLDGNSIAYQLLSMLTVLGALLLLQWKLLRLALGDPARTALCFVFTLLMLQPASYWGRENLAYQQALPLIFILAALWLAVARRSPGRWSLAAIFVLGVLSGLSYISGAFGALAAGIGVMFATRPSRLRAGHAGMHLAGGWLALAGAITSLAQVVFAIVPSKGQTYVAGKALALPNDANFWFYGLGKVGRSLLLPEDRPVLSLVVVALVLGLVVAMAVLVTRHAKSAGPLPDHELRHGAIFTAICTLVVTYLLMVAAGRTNYRPDEIRSAMEVFAYGFQRFHFFWATLLWPWLVAGCIVAADRWVAAGVIRAGVRTAGAVVLALMVASIVFLGALSHSERHQLDASFRRPTVDCLMTQLQQGDAIRCDEWRQLDLSPSLSYARRIGASFVRNFPILPIELGVDSPPPWFRLSRDGDRVEARNMERRSGRYHGAGGQAQLYVKAGPAASMAICVVLDVNGAITTANPDMVAVVFRPLGKKDYIPAHWQTQPVAGGSKARTFSFRLESFEGFEDSIRLDLVKSTQAFELGELEVRCRLKDRGDMAHPFFTIASGTVPAELSNIEPTGDAPGRFKAGVDSNVVFSTGKQDDMASCRFLEVVAVYQVEASDMAQLYFRRRGVDRFSEQDSVTVAVAPKAEVEDVTFIVESPTGFEDSLRLDPTMRPQSMQFADIKVRCLRRLVPSSR